MPSTINIHVNDTTPKTLDNKIDMKREKRGIPVMPIVSAKEVARKRIVWAKEGDHRRIVWAKEDADKRVVLVK